MVFVAIDLPQQRDVDEGQDRPARIHRLCLPELKLRSLTFRCTQ